MTSLSICEFFNMKTFLHNSSIFKIWNVIYACVHLSKAVLNEVQLKPCL